MSNNTSIIYENNEGIDKEIIIALISLTGSMCAALAGLVGVFLNRNFHSTKTVEVKKKQNVKVKAKLVEDSKRKTSPLKSPNLDIDKSKSADINLDIIEEYKGPCEILETKLDAGFFGVRVNQSNCQGIKIQCIFCKKHFCPYHIGPNNNGAFGGHVCNGLNP
jgi:hypothetical protein